MQNFKPRTKKPLLYEEVVNGLYSLIDENEIKPGDKFPSERELTELWDVSRNVLREAFHVLENRGIIVSKQGKGRFLRALPKNEPESELGQEKISKHLERYSLLEIYEVRQALEVKMIELVIRNASQDEVAALSTAVSELEQLFRQTNRTLGEFEIHRLYAKISGSLFLQQLEEIVLETTLDMMHNTFQEVLLIHDPEQNIADHKALLKAIENRDVAAGKDLMFRHVQRTIDMLN